MRTLPVVWKRVLDEHSKVCKRCHAIQAEIEDATARLRTALHPLGIDVTFEHKGVSAEHFRQTPAESNRLWVAEKPLETWLGGELGPVQRCTFCGDNQCPTVCVHGGCYEVVPADLIVRAGLLAAAELIGPEPEAGPPPCTGHPRRRRKPAAPG